MNSSIRQVSTLPSGINELNRVAVFEGYGMLQTLISNFRSIENCFDKRGEALYAVHKADRLVGIGGINIDPYFCQPDLGRIRHVYVHPDYRRSGVGRSLITRIERGAACYFKTFQLFTSHVEAALFYESLNYSPVVGKWKVSHTKPSSRITLYRATHE